LKPKILVAVVLLAQLSIAKAVKAIPPAEAPPIATSNVCKTCYPNAIPTGDRPVSEFQPSQLTLQLAQTTPSLDFLSDALEVANTLEDSAAKARVLSQIALKYAELDRSDRAEEILSEAITIADTIEDNTVKARILSELAIATAEIGNEQAATDLLDRALEVAGGLSDSPQKAGLFSELALSYDRLGVSDVSAQLLSQSQEIAIAAATPATEVSFPLEPTGWTGNVGLAATLSSGATTTSVATLSGAIERQWPTDELAAAVSLTNNFDDSRDETTGKSQFQGVLNTNYVHHTNARFQYFVNSQVRRDEFNDINLETSLFAGPGINLWRRGSDRSLDMQLGLGVRYENSNIEEDDFDAPVAQYRIRYEDIYFDVLDFGQLLTVELPLANAGDYQVESTTTFGIPLVRGWSFNNSLVVRYAAEPIADNPNLRFDVLTGIQYDF
jgi:putative salt-induced outer membrane protein YdiY